MSLSKKGGGKSSGKFPISVDHKPIVQVLGEMKLDVSDSDDWLVINNESSVRAGNYQQNSPNVPPKTWGQPSMIGRPRSYDQVSWGNFHTPTAGFVSRPPNFVNNNHNGIVMGPPWCDGQGFNGKGVGPVGFDGIRSKNGGGKRPVIVVDSDYDDDDEEEEEEDGEEMVEVEDEYSGMKCKRVANSKAPKKDVPQNFTSDPWGHPGVAPMPYMGRVHSPSGGFYPGFGNYGWRPTSVAPNPYMSKGPTPSNVPHPGFGNYGWKSTGVTPRPSMSEDYAPSDGFHPGYGNNGRTPAGRGIYVQPATCPPPPPLRGGGNSSAANMKKNSMKNGKSFSNVNSCDDGDVTDDDDAWSDEEVDCEDDVTQKTSSDQTGYPNHGQVGGGQRQAMPLKPVHRNLAHGFGYSQTEATKPVSKINGYSVSLGTAEHDQDYLRWLRMEEAKRQDLKISCNREGILPSGKTPTSGDTSCKMSVKNAGQEVENFSETESSEFDDDEESEFEGNKFHDLVSRPAGDSVREARENSGKKMEGNCNVKQASKLPKEKEVQCRKHQKKESGEATDVCAGDNPQMETKKVAEQSNSHASLLEDYKNRVKEMAKLVKFHITPKHEVDSCVSEREELMRIHELKLEMKKRHLEEEQGLEKQFAVALKRFVEKKTTVYSDSDASCEL